MKTIFFILLILTSTFSLSDVDETCRTTVLEAESANALLEYHGVKQLILEGKDKEALKKIQAHIDYRQSILEAIEKQNGLTEQSVQVLNFVNQ